MPTANALAKKSGICLYFSAHWCPPCRQFTPILADHYNRQYKKKNLEIVFISSDRDEASFNEYHSIMPWLALPYGERALKDELSRKFQVNGIPCLVVLDGEGKLVTVQGRDAVMSEPDKMFGLKVVNTAFEGKGQVLGGGASMTNLSPPNIWVDRSKLVTKLQFRFPDGQKITQEFNEDTILSEVVDFVSKCVGGKSISISSGFPPKILNELNNTIKIEDLFNAVVSVKIL